MRRFLSSPALLGLFCVLALTLALPAGVLVLAYADTGTHVFTAPAGVTVDPGLLSEELIAAGLIERGTSDQFVRINGTVIEVFTKPGAKRADVQAVLTAHDGKDAQDRERDGLAALEASWATATPAQKDAALRALVREAVRSRRRAGR